jgi:hypothetical protein
MLRITMEGILSFMKLSVKHRPGSFDHSAVARVRAPPCGRSDTRSALYDHSTTD